MNSVHSRKNLGRFYIVLALLFVVFTAIAFAVPFRKTPVFYLAYGFGLLAIAAQLVIQPRAFAQGVGARSKFYGFPLARIGVWYLAAQVVLSLLTMALTAILPLWVPLVIFVLLFAAAAVGLITVDAVRDEAERQDTSLADHTLSMRTLQSRAAALTEQCPAGSERRSLKKLSEALQYSDPVSSSATENIEHDLSNYLDELQTALIENDRKSIPEICSRTMNALSERNRICKLSKSTT